MKSLITEITLLVLKINEKPFLNADLNLDKHQIEIVVIKDEIPILFTFSDLNNEKDLLIMKQSLEKHAI